MVGREIQLREKLIAVERQLPVLGGLDLRRAEALGPAQVGLLEVGLGEAGSLEVGPDKVGLLELGPA